MRMGMGRGMGMGMGTCCVLIQRFGQVAYWSPSGHHPSLLTVAYLLHLTIPCLGMFTCQTGHRKQNKLPTGSSALDSWHFSVI